MTVWKNASAFKPQAGVLITDRLMSHLIKIGGIGVIAAVFGIFLFIFTQILPLFQSARVNPLQTLDLPSGFDFRVLGLDEWSEKPLLIDAAGRIFFADLAGDGGLEEARIPLPAPHEATAFRYNQQHQEIIYGTAEGLFTVVKVVYKPVFNGDERMIVPALEAGPLLEGGIPGAPVIDVDYGDAGTLKLAGMIQTVDGRPRVYAVILSQKRTLFGAGKTSVTGRFDLTSQTEGIPVRVAVNAHADGMAVLNASGGVSYFYADGRTVERRQVFYPFADLENKNVASLDFLLGGVSLVATSPSGANRVFSLLRGEGEGTRLFHRTKNFKNLPGGADTYAPSMRNKAFLIAHKDVASLRFSTTETVRWEKKLPFEISRGVISGKYDRLLFLDTQNRLHLYELHDPHPEAGFKAFFGKLWYEGYSEPRYEWQSTGGTDEFEPKLSLAPLFIGSLKGTLYALLFALPIAILAAIYTSQFSHPAFKRVVKPMMEIMASLPSVVLGFLAALWLAPLIENRVPSVILVIMTLPVTALVFGVIWRVLPIEKTLWMKPGYEFLILMPVLLLTGYAAWQAGPLLESLFFTDFRLWWPAVTGAPFEQRNSLVVGFVMGFAVIPIIFTITEDALSNVPATLRSASLALGASRWETTMRIVIPAASAGILSAVMIGFGRAVGETMIVVMATGNTPIMDFNIFSGMRTLSANIAVELPEAPFQGTLYRTLFLGALILFLMTFIVNTLAELLRERLRAKYKLS